MKVRGNCHVKTVLELVCCKRFAAAIWVIGVFTIPGLDVNVFSISFRLK